VGHTMRSSNLLHMKASLARVSQCCLKIGGCATVDGARGTITEVASEASCRRTGRCNKLCRTLLPYLYRFLPRCSISDGAVSALIHAQYQFLP
jgi:hypothetical protein